MSNDTKEAASTPRQSPVAHQPAPAPSGELPPLPRGVSRGATPFDDLFSFEQVRAAIAADRASRVELPEPMVQQVFRSDAPERYGYVSGWNACLEAVGAPASRPAATAAVPDAVRELPMQWRHNAQGCGRKEQHAAGTWRSCARDLESAIATIDQQQEARK